MQNRHEEHSKSAEELRAPLIEETTAKSLIPAATIQPAPSVSGVAKKKKPKKKK